MGSRKPANPNKKPMLSVVNDWDSPKDDELLTPEEVATDLHVKEATLAHWRSTGAYKLPFTKIGGKVMYLRGYVRQFKHAQTID